MRYTSFGECVMIMDGSLQEIQESDSNYELVMDLFSVRYKDYCYDSEFGLYYLQQRYYDPFTCRFISPDTILAEGQGTSSYNIFTYCGNNPVMYADHTGNVITAFVISVAQVASLLLAVNKATTFLKGVVLGVGVWISMSNCIFRALDVASSIAENGLISTITSSFRQFHCGDFFTIMSVTFGSVVFEQSALRYIGMTADLLLGAMTIATLLSAGEEMIITDATFASGVFYMVASLYETDLGLMNICLSNYGQLSMYIRDNYVDNMDAEQLASSHSTQEMIIKVMMGVYGE